MAFSAQAAIGCCLVGTSAVAFPLQGLGLCGDRLGVSDVLRSLRSCSRACPSERSPYPTCSSWYDSARTPCSTSTWPRAQLNAMPAGASGGSPFSRCRTETSTLWLDFVRSSQLVAGSLSLTVRSSSRPDSRCFRHSMRLIGRVAARGVRGECAASRVRRESGLDRRPPVGMNGVGSRVLRPAVRPELCRRRHGGRVLDQPWPTARP